MIRRGLIALALALVACGPGAASPNASAGSASDALDRALAAHQAGRLDEAVTGYFEVLSKDTKNKFAFYNLGEIAQRQNRLVAAESYYRLALEQDAKMTASLFNLAIVRTNVGDSAGAVDLYRRLIAADPNSAVGHFNLGLLLRQLGQTAEANTELATAQRLDPKLVPPAASSSPARQASPSPTGR